MNVKFNSETDLMYIHFFTGVPNILVPTEFADIGKFVAKGNHDQVIGYEIEAATENINFVIDSLVLSRKQKLAVIMCYLRENRKKTQKEFSTIINVSEGTYKSIERAEHNITFDTLDIIYSQFPKEEILHHIFA